MSCINQSVDHAPVEPSFADIKDRPKCTIPWLENDPVPTAPQPVGWLAGPGGVWPNREPWAEVSKR